MTECYMIENVEVISRIFDVLNEEENVIVVKLIHEGENIQLQKTSFIIG